MTDSGIAILALGLVLLLSKPRKLEAKDFVPTFERWGLDVKTPIYYSQYYDFATAAREEVEADPETELTVSRPITQTATRVGEWRTINGRIPTPLGTTIPIPTRRTHRIAVETMLEPIAEEKPEEYFADVEHNGKIIKSVNLRLKPL